MKLTKFNPIIIKIKWIFRNNQNHAETTDKMFKLNFTLKKTISKRTHCLQRFAQSSTPSLMF